MTSKNLFFKRLKQDIEQRIWLPVIFFIVGFLILELGLVSRFENWQRWEDFSERINNYLLHSFFSPDNIFFLVTCGVAMVCAISGFSYMHSAKKLDVYHSIPIKREVLFLQQYAYGFFYYLVPLLLHIVICLAVCGMNGVLSGAVLGHAVGFLWVQILLYLMCYSVTILAVCLTGNLVVSVLGSVVLLVYSLILVVLKEGLMEKFFMTFSGSNSVEDAGIWAFSPIQLFSNMVEEMEESTQEAFSYGNYWGFYVKMLLMAVVYGAAALYLYKKRPTETAGQSIAFPVTEPVIKTMVVFPVSILGGYFFSGVIAASNTMGWFVFGTIFAFLIVCPLMEIIFRKDIRAVLKHPLQLVFNGVCVIVILVIFRFDIFGYDTYIPAENKVVSYAIDIGQLSTIYSGYEDTYMYRLDNMEIVDNESTRKLLEYAAENTRPARTGKWDDKAEAGEVFYTYMEVKYNLKNGKSVYRSYLVNIKDNQVKEWLADTYNDVQHKLGAYPILDEDRDVEYIGVFLDAPFNEQELPLSEAKMEKLVETYKKELINLKFEELWAECPVLKIGFAMAPNEEEMKEWTYVTQENVYMESAFEYYEQETGYAIYPSFTQTLALLEEYGANIVSEIPVENIISITVEDYSEEVNDHDGLYDKVYTATYLPKDGQTEEVRQLLEAVLPSGFKGDFNAEEKVEPGVDVKIHYYMDEIERSSNCSIKKGMLPGFVREDMKKGL